MFGYTFYRGHILKKRRNLKRDASMAMALWFYRHQLFEYGGTSYWLEKGLPE